MFRSTPRMVVGPWLHRACPAVPALDKRSRSSFPSSRRAATGGRALRVDETVSRTQSVAGITQRPSDDRVREADGRTGRGERPNPTSCGSAGRREGARILDCARLLNRPGFRRNIRIGPRRLVLRPGLSGQLVAATTPCRPDPHGSGLPRSAAMPRLVSDRLSRLVPFVGARRLCPRLIRVPGRRRGLAPIRGPGLAIGRRVGTRARAVCRRGLRVPTLPVTAADYHRRSGARDMRCRSDLEPSERSVSSSSLCIGPHASHTAGLLLSGEVVS